MKSFVSFVCFCAVAFASCLYVLFPCSVSRASKAAVVMSDDYDAAIADLKHHLWLQPTQSESYACPVCRGTGNAGLMFSCGACNGKGSLVVEHLKFMPQVGPYGEFVGEWDDTQQRVTWVQNDPEILVTFEADPPVPLPAPKAVTITTDDLAAMINVAVERALAERFGPITYPHGSAGGCGAAVTVDASACGSSGTASTGRRGGGGLFGRLRGRRGSAGGCGG